MRQTGYLLMVVMVLATGCKDAETPETVAQKFYILCESARQEGFTTVQKPLYQLMSSDSVAGLEQCADTLSQRLNSPDLFSAEDCLVFQVYTGQRKEFTARRVNESDERVRLAIMSGSRERLLELVKEDGWRIDLEASLSLNQQQQSATP